MAISVPRLIVAGLSGDSGKTIVSLSLLAALRDQNLKAVAFKKGPDYIDAAWLSYAAGSSCRNLDTYMVDRDKVRSSFSSAAAGAGIAIVEGNRGLFDGKDITGTHSTASLAELLDCPVLLVVNCTKTTRTVAAMIKGCQSMQPGLNLAGVILNKVAGSRHAQIIKGAVEHYCDIPVVGVIPKLGRDASLIPGRHLGLVTPAEYDSPELRELLLKIASEHLQLDRILEIARQAPAFYEPAPPETITSSDQVRIGYFSDSVFTFYYPENLEALQRAGAELIEISSLQDKQLPPDLDALYIGGGFPETHASQLTDNKLLMKQVKAAADKGLPIYAECGGLVYLCRSLQTENGKFDMTGLWPVDLKMNLRPVGHGYTEMTVDQDNPFFATGTIIRGHEFHYSGPLDKTKLTGCMKMMTGVGLGGGRDGLVHKNSLACYSHIHAEGVEGWAEALTGAAADYKHHRTGGATHEMRQVASMEVTRPTGVVSVLPATK